MSGDAANTSIWTGADVYVAPVATAGPTDVSTAWPTDYKAAGLLDGENGFAEARSEDSNDFFAWGGVLVKTTHSKHKRTMKFTVLEDNDVVFDLLNPGSTRTVALGVTTSTVKVPVWPKISIGFEVTDGATIKRRFSKNAQVQEIGEVVESEGGLTAREVTVVLFPESDGTLYKEIQAAA